MHFYELLAEFNQPFQQTWWVLFIEANELLAITVVSLNATLTNLTAEIEKPAIQNKFYNKCF